MVLWINPWLGRVVDFEFEIWRNEARLDRGKVGADNLGGWKFVCKVSEQRQSSSQSFAGDRAHMAQIPVPVPTSSAVCATIASEQPCHRSSRHQIDQPECFGQSVQVINDCREAW